MLEFISCPPAAWRAGASRSSCISAPLLRSRMALAASAPSRTRQWARPTLSLARGADREAHHFLFRIVFYHICHTCNFRSRTWFHEAGSTATWIYPYVSTVVSAFTELWATHPGEALPCQRSLCQLRLGPQSQGQHHPGLSATSRRTVGISRSSSGMRRRYSRQTRGDER